MTADPLVLIHAGIADNRMWDELAQRLGGGHEVIRHEMRGFGQTPMSLGSFSMLNDLEAVVDRPSVLIGASFGGEVALAFADRSPELVRALVLMDAPVPDHDFSEEMTAYWKKENALVDAGDLDGAAELSVSFWVGGASDEVKALVGEMTRRSLELQLAGDPDADPGLPEVIDLSTVGVPSLVLAGDQDRADFRAIAERLARDLPRARLAWVPGAQHLPALERPEETARLIEEFLRDL